ncbi:MAG: FtsX-like permease family protein [Pirellulaceae bacterium]
MSMLDRKLLRDLWAMKGQALAIALVIGAGVATFVMSLSTLESLSSTLDAYYQRYRFAHVFASMKRAPNSLGERIVEIPGVAQTSLRIVEDVTLDVEGMIEPAVGRLISIPERPQGEPNALHLRRGRYIEPGRAGEVLVNEAFAEAHGFEPGDHVVAVINGRKQRLTIVGVALSPEYIIQLAGGSLLPDDRRFGVFWMAYPQLAAAFDMEGAFNNVALTLMHGASEPEVIERLDDLLDPYGGLGAYGRRDHLSHQYISDEIRQLRGMGMIAPAIFLSVATFLLNMVVSRVISLQREQIAALKAFGYRRWEVGLHYLKLVAAITLIGVALGVVAGSLLGRNLTEMYTTFYRFPLFSFHLDAGVAVLAVVVSVGAALLGTMTAVRRAVRLPPAEAMRPEPPAQYRPTFIERSGLGGFMPQTARMILRQLERSPLKSSLSSLGMALSVAVLILGSFSLDSIEYIMEFQFNLSQRYDLSLAFVEAAPGRVLHDVEHLPGVIDCEPFRSTPCRFRHGHHERRVAIMGLAPDSRLFRLLDREERQVEVPPEGLMLSEKLAELLHVTVGDLITVEVLEGQRPVRDVRVTALVAEFGGTNAYMNIDALRRLLREGDTASGVFLTVDADKLEALHGQIKESPRVAGVTVKTAALQSFRDTIAENLLRMRLFNIMFAGVIAFGVVYNSARISLSERSRELATLRVIGFTRGEISAILLGELAVLTVAAVPLGLVLGYLFGWLVTLGLDTEVYRIPLVINASTYAFAATVVMVAAFVSGLIVRERLDHLDLVAVLKSKE